MTNVHEQGNEKNPSLKKQAQNLIRIHAVTPFPAFYGLPGAQVELTALCNYTYANYTICPRQLQQRLQRRVFFLRENT